MIIPLVQEPWAQWGGPAGAFWESKTRTRRRRNHTNPLRSQVTCAAAPGEASLGLPHDVHVIPQASICEDEVLWSKKGMRQAPPPSCHCSHRCGGAPGPASPSSARGWAAPGGPATHKTTKGSPKGELKCDCADPADVQPPASTSGPRAHLGWGWGTTDAPGAGHQRPSTRGSHVGRQRPAQWGTLRLPAFLPARARARRLV